MWNLCNIFNIKILIGLYTCVYIVCAFKIAISRRPEHKKIRIFRFFMLFFTFPIALLWNLFMVIFVLGFIYFIVSFCSCIWYGIAGESFRKEFLTNVNIAGWVKSGDIPFVPMKW